MAEHPIKQVQRALMQAATRCECCDKDCDCGCLLECPKHHHLAITPETKENERVVAQDLSQRDIDPRDQHPNTPTVGVLVRQNMATDAVVTPETKENENDE